MYLSTLSCCSINARCFPKSFVLFFFPVFVKVLLYWDILNITASLVNGNVNDDADGRFQASLTDVPKVATLTHNIRSQGYTCFGKPLLLKFYSGQAT